MRIVLFSGSTGSGGANRTALALVAQLLDRHGADAIEAGDVAGISIDPFRRGSASGPSDVPDGIGFDTDGIP